MAPLLLVLHEWAMPRSSAFLIPKQKGDGKDAGSGAPGGNMKRRILGPAILASALGLAGVAVGSPLAIAQESSGAPASNSMHSAGASAEDAASSTGHAIKHAYEGTKTAVADTAITAKVKTALHENKITSGGDIHVHTVAGVVTLKGTARSRQESEAAQHVAQQTSGVRQVRNELTTASTATQ